MLEALVLLVLGPVVAHETLRTVALLKLGVALRVDSVLLGEELVVGGVVSLNVLPPSALPPARNELHVRKTFWRLGPVRLSNVPLGANFWGVGVMGRGATHLLALFGEGLRLSGESLPTLLALH